MSRTIAGMAESRAWLLPVLGLLLAACGGSDEGPGYRAAQPAGVPLPDAPVVRASVSGTGAELGRFGGGQPSLGGDGSWLVFTTNAANVDPRWSPTGGFVPFADERGRTSVAKDLRTGRVVAVPEEFDAEIAATAPERSASVDGQYLAVRGPDGALRVQSASAALRHLLKGQQLPPAGAQLAGYAAGAPQFSADGTKLVFVAVEALVPNDTNGQYDVYLRDLLNATTVRVSEAADGTQAVRDPRNTEAAEPFEDDDPDAMPEPLPLHSTPTVSADGNVIAFASGAANLVAGDTNRHGDLFVRNLAARSVVRVVGAKDTRTGCASLTADGTTLAFTYGRPTAANATSIGLADTATGKVRTFKVPRSAAGPWPVCPRITPDGAAILMFGRAVGESKTQRYDLWRAGIAGEDRAILSSVSTPRETSTATGLDRVAFTTTRALVPEDTNRTTDVYLRRVS